MSGVASHGSQVWTEGDERRQAGSSRLLMHPHTMAAEQQRQSLLQDKQALIVWHPASQGSTRSLARSLCRHFVCFKMPQPASSKQSCSNGWWGVVGREGAGSLWQYCTIQQDELTLLLKKLIIMQMQFIQFYLSCPLGGAHGRAFEYRGGSSRGWCVCHTPLCGIQLGVCAF